MISFLEGKLLTKSEDRVVVSVNGIGYEVLLPSIVRQTYNSKKAGEDGEQVKLHIFYHQSERQPKPLLVGFNCNIEKEFFEKHNYFGLPGEEIFFFKQGMLPAVDLSGKLLLESRGRLWMGPDGHGGSIRSLYASGALEEMERRGIEYIFFFQVDNPLTVMLDPVFLGCHQMAGTEISSKVVHKRSPEEKVGVLGKVNGWPGVVEYNDLSQEEKYACDEEGHLKFYAGNTAMQVVRGCRTDRALYLQHHGKLCIGPGMTGGSQQQHGNQQQRQTANSFEHHVTPGPSR